MGVLFIAGNLEGIFLCSKEPKVSIQHIPRRLGLCRPVCRSTGMLPRPSRLSGRLTLGQPEIVLPRAGPFLLLLALWGLPQQLFNLPECSHRPLEGNLTLLNLFGDRF